ncbi:PBECR2 nuclease fold domain-containing protein [Pseudomonas sp. HR96]|uniref:PBECR2 nuclease fold domain-containing protein n=1 Tax=Pseudomonas sp. HR96 TaxID=1027966 RepID=UPI002A756AA3|nr:PBECR2 nuclease fold domain-containing protein [Pseudomonas sp. HR96]WPO98072.1 PBECR2 nuclease fold domain-containing protein [Pseudomonas sp. HR96]
MPAVSYEEAIAIVALHLGFTAPDVCALKMGSPIGEVLIERQNLGHIVEKRQDARERYVRMAMDTLTGPFEIWRVAFSNCSYRLAFIGTYESRRQMLVSVALVDGRTLWNFMHTDAKSLNKHRHGELLYKRYELL